MVQLTKQIGTGDLSWREWVRTNLRLLAGSVAVASDLTLLQADIDAAQAEIDAAELLILPPATTTEVLTGTAVNRTVTPDALAALWEKGSDVAPAANMFLGEGGFFFITGSPATITDIDFNVQLNGRWAWCYFNSNTAGSILVNSATLWLPLSGNYTIKGDERALFVQTSGDEVRCMSLMRGDGSAVAPDKVSGFKNLLTNPYGKISQRGNPINIPDDTYGIDRWYILSQSGLAHIGYDANAPGWYAQNAHGSTQHFGMAQIIENANVLNQKIRGNQLTFSGAIAGDASYTVRYAILEWTGTADAVPSDVVNNWASGTYTAGNFFINTAGISVLGVGSIAAVAGGLVPITPLTVTVSGSANNIIVFIWGSSLLTTHRFYTGRLQLERGALATEAEYRPHAVELVLCQRYFQKSYNEAVALGTVTSVGEVRYQAANTGGEAAPAIRFPVEMRITPTATLYSPATGASGQKRNLTGAADVAMTFNSIGAAGASGSSNHTAASIYSYHYAMNAEL